MKFRSVIQIILLLSLFIDAAYLSAAQITMKIGTLPVLQALPLFVAEKIGLLHFNDVKVELVMFNTASEKDIALSSGVIDGYFGDLLTPIVLEGNGKNVSIVATNYDTRDDRRMFGILAKPGSKFLSINDLAGVPVAISSNSVVHYVFDNLMSKAGIPAEKRELLESKNIGLRMQLLLSGQIEAAALPEPLVTMAQSKGAVILADDAGLAASQTVLAFNKSYLSKHRDTVKRFLMALDEASSKINNDPETVRSIMVEYTRMPEQLKDVYPVPKFPKLRVPQSDDVIPILQWLKQSGIAPEALDYKKVVDDTILK